MQVSVNHNLAMMIIDGWENRCKELQEERDRYRAALEYVIDLANEYNIAEVRRARWALEGKDDE